MLEELWGARSSQQFVAFAQNILDRRFTRQSIVPGGSFVQYLAEQLTVEGLDEAYANSLRRLEEEVNKVRNSDRFSEWTAIIERAPSVVTPEALFRIFRPAY